MWLPKAAFFPPFLLFCDPSYYKELEGEEKGRDRRCVGEFGQGGTSPVGRCKAVLGVDEVTMQAAHVVLCPPLPRALPSSESRYGVGRTARV